MGDILRKVLTNVNLAITSFNPVSFAINYVISLAVSKVMTNVFAKKPASNSKQLQSRTDMVKNPIVPRDIVYGLTKKSGAVVFMETSNNNKNLHFIVTVASHEIESFEKIYFNDEELTLASAGTDLNGLTIYKVTSPEKYARESHFTTKTKSFVVSEYTDLVYNNALPFGGYLVTAEKGLAKNRTSITLISDVIFAISTGTSLNINGADYVVATGGTATGSGIRFTLTITLATGLITDVRATAINYNDVTPSGNIPTRISIYRNNPNTPLPFLSGTSTTINYAILAELTFTDSSSLTVRIKQHLGEDNQLADADLVNDVAKWTSSHSLSGIAYLAITLIYDSDIFADGIPNISAEIKGKKLYDFRTTTTAFSKNPALVLYDYLTDTRFGLGVSDTEIDTDSFTTIANICDENINLSAGGTEKKYEANGIIYSNIEPMVNIDNINNSMLGILSYSNGKFYLAGADYVSPTVTLDEDDFVSGFTVQTKQSRRNSFNTVKGVFTSSESNWQPSDYPIVSSSVFIAEDNDTTIFENIDLPFTISSTMAQRIAKIFLFRNRQQMVIEASVKMIGFTLQVGDTVQINNTRLGFSNKEFQIVDWTFTMNEKEMNIKLTMQETSENIWDWDAEEEEFISDNTTLPHFEDVSPPSITATDIMRSYSGVISTVLIVEVASSQGMTNEFEIEYRNTSTDLDYITLGRSRGTKFEILNVEDGMIYQIRARSINSFNVASTYTSITHEIIGKTAIPNDVTDFAVNIVNNLAVCSWTANSELDLSHYIIRHSPSTSGAVYAGSSIVANYIPKALNQITVPAQTGTYMIKAVDVLGLASETSAKKVVIRNQISDDFNVVATTTESPTFAGTKTDTEVVTRDSINYLQIILGELFDDHSGFFDSALGNFDDGGEVANNLDGFYDFASNPIDLGAIYNSYIVTSLSSSRFNANSLFDSFEGLFDTQEGNFDGSYTEQDDVSASIQISTSNDNITYSSYQDYILGSYKGRYINLRAKLTTNNASSTPAISALSAVIDMPDRTFAVDDIASGTSAGGLVVTFSPSFQSLEGLGISADNLASGDFYEILAKSSSGFTIRFKNSSSTVVNRTFGYVAKGFGYLESS